MGLANHGGVAEVGAVEGHHRRREQAAIVSLQLTLGSRHIFSVQYNALSPLLLHFSEHGEIREHCHAQTETQIVAENELKVDTAPKPTFNSICPIGCEIFGMPAKAVACPGRGGVLQRLTKGDMETAVTMQPRKRVRQMMDTLKLQSPPLEGLK